MTFYCRDMNNAKIGYRKLVATIAMLLVIGACDSGDQYTEDGQLVEKKDVRVAGVDFGKAVDSVGRVTAKADTFAPSDHIFAAVRTRGTSPKTVLGVRWKDPKGDQVVMNNVVIRPTGDTTTVFDFHHLVDLNPGRYTLDVRVNGKVVRSADFTVK